MILWSDALLVGVGFIDRDHQDAVETINRMAVASSHGRPVLADLESFRHHCGEHFGREEDMMRQVGFFALEPHSGEHERVLAEMDLILERVRAGEACSAYFAEALPQWFLEHRATMDSVTADFARSRGWTSA